MTDVTKADKTIRCCLLFAQALDEQRLKCGAVLPLVARNERVHVRRSVLMVRDVHRHGTQSDHEGKR